MTESKFALRMLEKQGWKDGDGLGKNKDGISKPIKAFIKRDKAGVGQDLGANLTDHWWLRVFNDAAKNVTKTNEASDNQLPKNSLYAGFRKGSTLKQGKEEKDSDCSSEDEEEENVVLPIVPTLDDIHKYCGGATGHRAATLGIKMTGKLKRAREHERLYNERSQHSNTDNGNDRLNSDIDMTERTVKKKKRKDAEKEDDVEKCVASLTSIETLGDDSKCATDVGETKSFQEEKIKRKKSKKKKKQRKEKEENCLLSDECAEVEDSIPTKKRKKSKSNDENHIQSMVGENIDSVDCDSNVKQKRKKKKKHKEL